MHGKFLIALCFLFSQTVAAQEPQLLRMVSDKFAGASEALACTVVQPVSEAKTGKSVKSPSRQRPVTRIDSFYTIRLLELYSPKAAESNGGEEQMRAKIQLAVDNLNEDVQRSGIWNAHFELGCTGLMIPVSANGLQVLLNMPENPEIAMRRDLCGAQLVGFWMEDGSCAFLPNLENPSPDQGFHVILADDRGADHLLSHEIWHNFGGQHDGKNLPPSGTHYWARGLCNQVEPKFRTIMAVSCPDLPLIRRFSNPEVYHFGVPTGIKDEADNVRMFRMTLPMIAKYR